MYHRVVDGAQSAQFLETSKKLLENPGQPVNAMSAPVAFSLKPVPPFRLHLTAWALRRRPGNVIDRSDGQTYRRALVLNGHSTEVAVAQSRPPNSPRLRVTIRGPRLTSDIKALARKALERLLGLRINLTAFYQLAAGEPKLGALAQRFCGLKRPRLPMVFEALAYANACQLMSLSAGILLLNRITEKFGVAVEGTAGIAHAFPQPEDLVGRWSAEYVLLRGLGRLNVYPGDDVGARNNLKCWLKLRKPLDYEGVRRVTAKWQPYAGFVYFHMLLDRLDAARHLAPKSAADQLGGRVDDTR